MTIDKPMEIAYCDIKHIIIDIVLVGSVNVPNTVEWTSQRKGDRTREQSDSVKSSAQKSQTSEQFSSTAIVT